MVSVRSMRALFCSNVSPSIGLKLGCTLGGVEAAPDAVPAVEGTVVVSSAPSPFPFDRRVVVKILAVGAFLVGQGRSSRIRSRCWCRWRAASVTSGGLVDRTWYRRSAGNRRWRWRARKKALAVGHGRARQVVAAGHRRRPLPRRPK